MTAVDETAGYCAKRPWLEVPGMPRVMIERTHERSCFCRKSRL